jgi:multicomponent Na+:H+ antiporter subunit E
LRAAGMALLLALAWLGLNGGDHRSWLIGVPAVLAAAALGATLPARHPLRLRWRGLPRFALFFLHQSLRGAWDVARRVLHPRLPVKPGFLRFTTRLPPGPARHLFLNVVSLLPGTLSAGQEADQVTIHALDLHGGVEDELRDLEKRVGGLFVEVKEDRA